MAGIKAKEGDFADLKAGDVAGALRKAFVRTEVRDKVREVYGIPTADEITFDPEGAWKSLGNSSKTPDTVEVLAAASAKFEEKAFRLFNIIDEKSQGSQVTYRFILSELMKAFQHGWLVEIQEAASVLRPGVLTELNSLLEPNGRIELPNGTYVYRHPDTVVIFTTNRDYQGNVDLNESLRDRCTLGVKMDLPDVNTMAARGMAQSGLTDAAVALSAAKAVHAVYEEAKSKVIRGNFGMRSLSAWMVDLSRGDFSDDTFKMRVISKMTTRDEDVSALMDVYRSNCDFASKVKSGKKKRV
jgi:type I restriction-modification system DNA methylase subunit